jgi:PHD/YefM family antitoxin component YafN of YafNO toxin-antitoxin module
MTRLPASQLSQAVDLLMHEGERVLIERDGSPIAALVSVEDLALLEELEDAADVEAARAALAEPGENIPYEQVRRELGLTE